MIFNVVQDFLASGNAVDDDTAAVENAIEAATKYVDDQINNQGYNLTHAPVVYFPPGTYRLTRPILVERHFIKLTGAGINSTILVKDHPGNGVLIAYRKSVKNLNSTNTRITDCMLGHFTIKSLKRESSGTMIKCQAALRLQLTDIYIDNGFGAIWIEGGQKIQISNIECFATNIEPGNSFFLCITPSTRPNTDTGEIFVNNFNAVAKENTIRHGIYISACDGLWVSNLHILRAAYAGLHIDNKFADHPIQGLIFNNTWLDHGSDYNVIIKGSGNAVSKNYSFSNCIFMGAREFGLLIPAGSKFGPIHINNSIFDSTKGRSVQASSNRLMLSNNSYTASVVINSKINPFDEK